MQACRDLSSSVYGVVSTSVKLTVLVQQGLIGCIRWLRPFHLSRMPDSN